MWLSVASFFPRPSGFTPITFGVPLPQHTAARPNKVWVNITGPTRLALHLGCLMVTLHVDVLNMHRVCHKPYARHPHVRHAAWVRSHISLSNLSSTPPPATPNLSPWAPMHPRTAPPSHTAQTALSRLRPALSQAHRPFNHRAHPVLDPPSTRRWIEF